MNFHKHFQPPVSIKRQNRTADQRLIPGKKSTTMAYLILWRVNERTEFFRYANDGRNIGNYRTGVATWQNHNTESRRIIFIIRPQQCAVSFINANIMYRKKVG